MGKILRELACPGPECSGKKASVDKFCASPAFARLLLRERQGYVDGALGSAESHPSLCDYRIGSYVGCTGSVSHAVA